MNLIRPGAAVAVGACATSSAAFQLLRQLCHFKIPQIAVLTAGCGILIHENTPGKVQVQYCGILPVWIPRRMAVLGCFDGRLPGLDVQNPISKGFCLCLGDFETTRSAGNINALKSNCLNSQLLNATDMGGPLDIQYTLVMNMTL